MRVLALDLSTNAGWAVLETAHPVSASLGDPLPIPVDVFDIGLGEHGTISLEQAAANCGNGVYPWNYYTAACQIAGDIDGLQRRFKPDVIVIEETNLGKQRYSQKILEWIHFMVLRWLFDSQLPLGRIVYISTSSWRKTLNLRLSAADKKANAKLSRAKSKAKATGGKLDKKSLGIKGRRDWKHLSVEFVNATYGTSFIMKDNDITDAICLGTAYLRGATVCDGLGNFN